MDRQQSDASPERLSAFLDEPASVIGHAARVGPMRDDCTGLPLSCERKAGVPEQIELTTKPKMALRQIDWAVVVRPSPLVRPQSIG